MFAHKIAPSAYKRIDDVLAEIINVKLGKIGDFASCLPASGGNNVTCGELVEPEPFLSGKMSIFTYPI